MNQASASYKISQRAELVDRIRDNRPVNAMIMLNNGTNEEDITRIIAEIRKYARISSLPSPQIGDYTVGVTIKDPKKGILLIGFCDSTPFVDYYQASGETKGEYVPKLRYCFG